ncbi:hypothetical protein [Roseovarius indicus]|uniref:Uncharacterized protein n=1 Tax=Roseovarius indicus TaxID=540747 RepID=A0A5P3AH01_9RHOB|nr:hypothetical protein [Roseovarius indicus]QEW28647.1 hypothetical protein RIdsm_04479 [Roseovarius indicus]SFE65281.1 hypothetical protein SAMN04488031_1157 [Roseovarius indicus]
MNRADISRATKDAYERLEHQFPKISTMPRDPRGLPIPANVAANPGNGKSIFAVIDLNKQIDLFCSKRCAVTGTVLDPTDVWFVTTSDSALVPFGLFLDAPMCGEAKDFTLQVCPYFGISGYSRISDDQAKAMVSGRNTLISGNDKSLPSEFLAVRVNGFTVVPTSQGLHFLPDRHYSRIEWWVGRTCKRVVEGPEVRVEIAKGIQDGLSKLAAGQWPQWAKQSLDGSLIDCWPWEEPRAAETLFHKAKELNGE